MFRDDKAGSIAIFFAVVLLICAAVAGAAVDYSRSLNRRTHLQAALDAAVQSAATNQGNQAAKIAAFESTFNTHVSLLTDLSNIKATPTIESSRVYGEATADANSTLLSVLGKRAIQIGVKSEMMFGAGSVEFVIAMDVSGSMQLPMSGGTDLISAAKDAATALIDTATGGTSNPNVKVGIVPFTMNVNIGTANAKYVVGTTHALFSGTQWAGCVVERAPPYHINNVYDGSATSPAGMWHAYIWPPEPNNNNACYNRSNGTNSGYQTKAQWTPLVPKTLGVNYNCVGYPMVPITTNAASVKSAIAGLRSVGNHGTIFGVGVSWAYRLLTPNAPFPGPNPMDGKTRKVIIVLTDGEQTTESSYRPTTCSQQQNSSEAYKFNPADFKMGGKALATTGPKDFFSAYGYILDSDPMNNKFTDLKAVDKGLSAISVSACDEAKKGGVEIYAIAVSTGAGPGTEIYNALKSCASDSDHFFYVTNKQAFVNSFISIAGNSTQVRRSR